MTNEELVVAIQGGRKDLMLELWDQNMRFVYGKANAWKRAFERITFVDVDDLVQSAWLALEDAVRYFQPGEENNHSFLTPFNWFMHIYFARQFGVRSSKRDASMRAESIDGPLKNDPDYSSLAEFIPDPAAEMAFEQVEESDLQRRIREVLQEVSTDILNNEQRKVYDALMADLRVGDLASEAGVSTTTIYTQRQKLFDLLRTDPRIIQLWIEVEETEESIESILANGLKSVGVQSFNETGSSSVERAVFKMMRQDCKRMNKTKELLWVMGIKLHDKDAVEEYEKQRRACLRAEYVAYEKRRAERLAAASSQ
ncbi:MAG: sigma-70 family RNA polymerase sigma factor [Clostridia bacterium]|nr:sigma-70 family RNA polymerase sigma factor [Clostridia bacterium]